MWDDIFSERRKMRDIRDMRGMKKSGEAYFTGILQWVCE